MEIEVFEVGELETNCYLVYSGATKTGFLIDPGAFDARIEDSIKAKGIKVRAIINTHGHSDHTGGDKRFGYPVFIHEKDKSFLTNPIKNLSFLTGIASAAPSEIRVVKDGDVIGEGDMRFEVMHTPGHTPGGISLRSGNKVFTGDTLFYEGVGRTDLPYSSTRDLMASINGKLMPLPDETVVFPGHGPSTTIGHEKRNNPFLGGQG